MNDAAFDEATEQMATAMQLRSVGRAAAKLVHDRSATPVLRSTKPLQEVACGPGGTFWDCLLTLKAMADGREEAIFMMSMAAKCPLITDIASHHEDRFWRVERLDGHQLSSEALILCAISDAIAFSIPSSEVWKSDQLVVPFRELISGDVLQEDEERIDNIAIEDHGDIVLERGRGRARASISIETLWDMRAVVYPSLNFAPGVAANILALDQSGFQVVCKRLGELELSVASWKQTGGAIPNWRSKVSPESDRVLNDPDLRKARVFRGLDGQEHLYEWHARYGSGGRVHFRFEALGQYLEIGYIGAHLPL